MPESLHRTQLLLKPIQYRTLRKISEEQGRSISDLVREIITLYLEEIQNQSVWAQRMETVRKLTDLRTKSAERTGEYAGDLLEPTRREWDLKERGKSA